MILTQSHGDTDWHGRTWTGTDGGRWASVPPMLTKIKGHTPWKGPGTSNIQHTP
ncbi:MAG: hypothetical protein PF904_20660 [Kiritimatiellae bacterium]|nr:hypothetical protein [Kiritimatiellia bacterium]